MMTKYITIKLTEDQAIELISLCNIWNKELETSKSKKAFRKRLATKIKAELGLS